MRAYTGTKMLSFLKLVFSLNILIDAIPHMTKILPPLSPPTHKRENLLKFLQDIIIHNINFENEFKNCEIINLNNYFFNAITLIIILLKIIIQKYFFSVRGSLILSNS